MVPSVGPGRWLRVRPSVVWLPGVDGRVIAPAISSALRGVVRGISTNMEGSSGWVLIRDKPSSLIWVEAGTNSQLSKDDIVCNSNKI